MSGQSSSPNSAQNKEQGSVWNRWDPHIHIPGTVLNDNYSGSDAFNDFLNRIEQSEPRIKALGITDYLTAASYEKILAAKKSGRLSDVELIFPNIEFRFGIGTAKGGPLNAHLLVSPEEADHLNELKRFLNGLEYVFDGDTFRCNKDDLIKLGKKHDKNVTTDQKALEIGTNQFKVSARELYQRIQESEWAKQNVLIAVSGNEDGTPGLQQDSSLSSLRKELERNAHIIFSANEKTREFWLGLKAATINELTEGWGGTKPCIHGSDAHENSKVGNPDMGRYTWIKGDLTFESLRQVCLEPAERVTIGELCPDAGNTSKAIKEIEIQNAAWMSTPKLPLNIGLIAIIGARGSGKTALADLIAAGSYALSTQLNEGSFIKRAKALIKDERAVLTWASDEKTDNYLSSVEMEDILDTSRVQYLSQQFVEELCSAEGVSDKLMEEVERVIFHAHNPADRQGLNSFQELLQMKSENAKNMREVHEENLRQISNDLIVEYERKDGLPQLLQKLRETETNIANDKKSRDALISKGEKERLQKFDEVNIALDTIRLRLDAANRKYQALEKLQLTVHTMSNTSFSTQLERLKQENPSTGLSEDKWKSFKLVFTGDVKKLLSDEIYHAKNASDAIRGPIVNRLRLDKSKSYLSTGKALIEHSFNILTAECERLQELIGLDKENTRKLRLLNDRINASETIANSLRHDVEMAEQAPSRIERLLKDRKNAYEGVFQAIVEEENQLTLLYEPLRENLGQQKGTLAKLNFNVHRIVDIENWAERGEQLIDLRQTGPFRRKGTLATAVKEELLEAWSNGTASEVATAMDSFRKKYDNQLFAQAPTLKDNRAEYRKWVKNIGEWLYGTDHIDVKYGIQYSGLNIRQLSPGTRGIVLLMLYLAIDMDDDRPLMIDQPEENLDPKSIYDELVPLFRKARHRRQIIIVTHNANLVVNTDADQVIVATAGEHKINHLPLIKYESGGIENPFIREKICEILEGGESAFQERAKRLRINFEK